MISIAKSRNSHLSILTQIGKRQWPKEKWISRHYLYHTLQKKGFHFTALLNGKIVGSIMVVEEDYPKYWIHYFIVDKDYRRQGIGSALLRKVESKLPKNTFLFVDLEEKDKTAFSFYQNNNFEVMGTVKNWFTGKEGIIMAKKK